METTYTLADVVRLAKPKRRSAQLWADHGVLRPLEGTARAGTGTYKRFDRIELQVAAVMAAVAEAGMPIGNLYALSASLREILLPASPATVGAGTIEDFPVWREWRKYVRDALAGVQTIYFVCGRNAEGGWNVRLTPAIKLAETLEEMGQLRFSGVVNLTTCLTSLKLDPEPSS